MIKNILTLFVIFFSAQSFAQASEPDKTIPLKVGDINITDQLIVKLQSNDEWYRSIDETTLEIPYPPPQYIIDFVSSETNKIIPQGRSSAISPDLRPDVIKQLNEKNISYNLVIFDKEQWLVWDIKDTEKVKSVIQSVAIKALNAR